MGAIFCSIATKLAVGLPTTKIVRLAFGTRLPHLYAVTWKEDKENTWPDLRAITRTI